MRYFWLSVFVLLFSVSSWAADKNLCSKPGTATPDTISNTLVMYKDNCSQAIADKRLAKINVELKSKKEAVLQTGWKGLEDDIGKDMIDFPQDDGLAQVFQEIQRRFVQAGVDSAKAPETESVNMAVANVWDLTGDLYILPVGDGTDYRFIQLKPVIEKVCRAEGKNCPTTLARSKTLVNYLASAEQFGEIYSKETIGKLKKELEAMAEKWNTFFYDSKPMYPSDIWFTDFIYSVCSKENRSTYVNGFRNPPEWQFFILHPSAAIEYVDKAEDGDQLKPAVFAELLGVNRWEKGFLGLTGVSAIVSYSDHKNLSDIGWGGLLTFDNVYSFGITARSSEYGIFVSLDLANLFREKIKPSWDKYKNLKLPLRESSDNN